MLGREPPRQEVGPAAIRVDRRPGAVGDRVAHRHDGAGRRLRPHVDARQIEPLLRVAIVIELLGADVIARCRHVRRRQPGHMHGGRRGRPPGVARQMEIDDQIAERRHREGDRIAQHRRARLDGDRGMAPEGQVGASANGLAAGPRRDVGGADLERLGAEQVRHRHPHLRPADARPDDLPNRLVPHPHRRARRRRRHLFGLHLGRRRLDRDGPRRPGADPPALRGRDRGSRQEDRGDGGQGKREGARAGRPKHRTESRPGPENPANHHPVNPSLTPGRKNPRPAWTLHEAAYIVPSCRPAGASRPTGRSKPTVPVTREPVASEQPPGAARNHRTPRVPQDTHVSGSGA